MFCAIYKSTRKQDAYLYLADKDEFANVPEALLTMLGEPVHVMDLELSPTLRLAQENVLEVMRNLQERGWFLQLPRQEYRLPSQ
ncbi:MAG: YcgL domain-containing protein [Gammaproteobacteria bacterium]|nr:YcgL domain-containing protein [Gammaproteobacteria bacterium]MCP5423837.1 YcgL domain-containing protein [Gammaproteobacteria bacterium]